MKNDQGEGNCMKVYGKTISLSFLLSHPKLMQVCGLKNDGMTVGKAHS